MIRKKTMKNKKSKKNFNKQIAFLSMVIPKEEDLPKSLKEDIFKDLSNEDKLMLKQFLKYMSIW